MGKILRRSFLIGSAAVVGGVAFGAYYINKPYANPLKTGDGAYTLNPFLFIDKNGVTVIAPRAEMGQGIHSTLAALVAEELDMPWDQVKVIHGPASKAYYNSAMLEASVPFPEYTESFAKSAMQTVMGTMGKVMGVQATGGSSSTVDGYVKMRKAGASAYQVLLQAAADEFGVSNDQITSKDGAMVSPDGKSLTYSQLAEKAAKLSPPSDPVLKDPKDWKLLGKSLPRLDMVAKVTGAAEFGIDVRLEGMKFASVRANPHLGAGMKSYDASKAEKMPGVIKIVDMGNGVAAVASNTWAAIQAVNAVEVEWEDASYPAEQEDIVTRLRAAYNTEVNSTLRNDGDIAEALANPKGKVFETEYHAPYLAHAAMEPMNATALYENGELNLWTGNQAPLVITEKAAEVAGLDVDKVTVHTPFMGGAFGRRIETDASNQAAKLAMTMEGTPVQVTWSREEDMQHDFYRPISMAKATAVISDDGAHAVKIDIATPSVSNAALMRMMGFAPGGEDKTAVEGAFDQPYGFENFQVNGFHADLSVPIGFWRSVGNSHNSFFLETFMDEIARQANVDPVEMRLKLMKNVDEASYKVLQTVAEMSGWGEKKAGIGRGVAFCYSFGTPTAQVIDVSKTNDGIKIEKVWCAADVGVALDKKNVEAQLMSGIIYGLSAAVKGEITFSEGQVEQSNFTDYEPLLMVDAPAIEIKVLENKEHLSGVGEPGTPPSIPALGNAIFDLLGLRVRNLPMNNQVGFL